MKSFTFLFFFYSGIAQASSYLSVTNTINPDNTISVSQCEELVGDPCLDALVDNRWPGVKLCIKASRPIPGGKTYWTQAMIFDTKADCVAMAEVLQEQVVAKKYRKWETYEDILRKILQDKK